MTEQDAPPRPEPWDPPTWWQKEAMAYIEHLEAENRLQKKDLAWAEVQEGRERARRMKVEARTEELEGQRDLLQEQLTHWEDQSTRIAELERFLDDIATHDDDVELVPPAEELTVWPIPPLSGETINDYKNRLQEIEPPAPPSKACSPGQHIGPITMRNALGNVMDGSYCKACGQPVDEPPAEGPEEEE